MYYITSVSCRMTTTNDIPQRNNNILGRIIEERLIQLNPLHLFICLFPGFLKKFKSKTKGGWSKSHSFDLIYLTLLALPLQNRSRMIFLGLITNQSSTYCSRPTFQSSDKRRWPCFNEDSVAASKYVLGNQRQIDKRRTKAKRMKIRACRFRNPKGHVSLSSWTASRYHKSRMPNILECI